MTFDEIYNNIVNEITPDVSKKIQFGLYFIVARRDNF